MVLWRRHLWGDAMHITSLAAGLVLATTLSLAPALACQKPAGAEGIAGALADWINAERGKKGLSRLAASGQLDKAAGAHACDMVERDFFGHKGPGGPSFQKRLNKAGYDFSAAVENIARTSAASADAAAKVWRNSSEHWSNILNPSLREIGIAVATDGEQTYYVFVGGG